jgi:hypothetical protein
MLWKRVQWFLVCLAILALAGTSQAQAPPDSNMSYATYTAYPTTVSCCIYPNGQGTPLANCFQFGGTRINATITVTLLGAAGLPVPLVPATNIRLRTTLTGVTWCPIVITPRGAFPGYECIADAPTNAAGQTTFSFSPWGGMYTFPALGERCQVYVVWGTTIIPVKGTCPTGGPPSSLLDIQFNSPDLDGTGVVNLGDVVIFATDYFGPYNYRSDFYWDGLVNLSDIVLIAQALTAACPP